jgi:hypothetical protein
MKINVHRIVSDISETLGELELIDVSGKKIFECKTLELPEKNNQQRISCIPKGIYQCVKVAPTANIPYIHISILSVPNRSGVCIHTANYVTQLLGCIAVGSDFRDINNDGKLDVINSTKTFKELMVLLPDGFELEIK